MPSLYRVIKNNVIAERNEKVIETDFEEVIEKAVNEGDVRTFVSSYESLSKSIIENARKQGREILIKAYEEADNTVSNADKKAADVYKQAYDRGYAEGEEKGYKDAYEEAYQKNLDSANKEIEVMKKNADNILFQAHKEYDKYLIDKENEIRAVILDICKAVLKREAKETDGINSMVFSAVSEIKGASSIIIRCHPNRSAYIKKEIEGWKEQLAFNGDLFVLEDAFVKEDSAVIEKENGKIITGIDIAVSKINEILGDTPDSSIDKGGVSS